MVIIRVVEAARRGRRNSRDVGKRISRGRTIFDGRTGSRDVFVGVIDGGWVAVHSDGTGVIAGSRQVPPSGRAGLIWPRRLDYDWDGSQDLWKQTNMYITVIRILLHLARKTIEATYGFTIFQDKWASFESWTRRWGAFIGRIRGV